MTTSSVRHGGKVLVECLENQGVRRVFCVPGESYLSALDGLYDSDVDTIICRHEGGAAMMAEAHAKATGEAGVAFVTRGPGATNASSGVHVAFQDSTPMVLFIGQVASDQRDREAFQEVDYRAMFGPLAKWVGEVDRTDRLPEYISHAFHVAQSGRPGPVILALPEDILSADTNAMPVPVAVLPSGRAAESDVTSVLEMLQEAERPLIIVGGGAWSESAGLALGEFAKATGIPVGASFRCQDYLDNRHPCYIGDIGIGINPALAERVKSADVILALGTRLGEMTTSGYTLLTPPVASQQLIHVHADPSEIGRVYRPKLAVVANAGEFAKQLAAAAPSTALPASSWMSDARNDFDTWQKPVETPGDLKMEQVITHLNEVLEDDAILTNGAGNYSAWLHRYYRYRSWRTQLAPTSGSMGYGLPAAIAAKLEYPDRDVICLAGDGCFQMVSQEFGTAMQYGANVIVLVSNNGMYGTIRMHQQKRYPKRPSGTHLVNPDFAAFAESYGGFGATVNNQAEFVSALARARAANRPSILDLKVSPTALSPRALLETID
ncbi:thiamine pyrophosphate-binding protein [Granulosicoccus sp. 3-233]|uniref:thiamine pyrophosphate-binding protein n=1 Tax=Granulosicoccus sp. 3-233 TaxID=3417969 RepID=UPI003D33B617